jgi:hypothetical protein
MKQILRVVLVLLVLVSIFASAFNSRTYAAADTSSAGGPNVGAGPMPSLTPEQKAVRNKKEADFQKWLSIQPKDINPLDIPSVTNQNDVSPLSAESGYISIPLRIQQQTYWCGPASAQEVLDYDWSYLSSESKYSQSTLASNMGTDTTGTYVYKVTNALNQYKYNPNFNWIYYLISSDETTAADTIYSFQKYDVSNYEGMIYHTVTYPYYGFDSWGERYGLIGYFNPSTTTEFYNYGHYVAGYGYSQDSSGRHKVSYLDSYQQNFGWGATQGAHSVDTRNMATCVIYNAQYVIY